MMFSRSVLVGAVGLLLGLSGCVEVTFPEPMPANRKELSEFPSHWRGTWTSHARGIEAAGDDEIMVIEADRILGNGDGEDLVLGQTCVLKKMGRSLVLSTPSETRGRHSVMVARIRGDKLEVRAFDPEQKGGIDTWEHVLGHERVVKIHKKDDPTNKLREVQLNPKSTCQFRKLVREGSHELVTYTRVREGRTP